MLPFLAVVSVITGYLLGAIPTSYLVGRYWGKIDLRKEGLSHVSATAVYRELGWAPFIPVIAVDILKGMVAITIANILTDPLWVVVITCIAAAAGHCWSVFIKFHGGLGSVVIYGMLLYLVPIEFFIGGAVALIVMLTTKKSTLTTVLWLGIISLELFLEIIFLKNGRGLALALLPLAFMAVQFLKQLQSRREGDVYKNELVSDFRRVKKV